MSSTLIDARGVVRRHGDRTILSALDLRVSTGDRIAVLGDNGTGKSTLLRLLAGRDQPDAGMITAHGTTTYVPQLARSSRSTATVRALAEDALGVASASRQLEAAELALTHSRDPDRAISEHAGALEAWLSVGGPTVAADLDRAADLLGLTPGLLDRPRSTLSSGQGARASLLPVAARPADLLLLDEPTNHLDAAGRQALTELLDRHRGALVVASHDRELLARFADQVLELKPRGAAATIYGGGWRAYERERDTATRHAEEAYTAAIAQRAELERAEGEIRRRAAATRRRVDHGGRDGDKHIKEWFRSRADGVAARGRVIGERAARVEIPDKPWQEAPLQLELSPEEQRAPFVVALDGAVLRRGDWTSAPVDFAVASGERVLLRGPNGSGKSALLLALAGTLPPASGRRRQGTGAVVSVLGAVETALESDREVAAVMAALTGLPLSAARGRLAQAGVPAEVASRPACTLSPGERTRAELAVLAARRTTCLLLDEPTNHLDLRSVEALEVALEGWPGAVVLATHDERLAEQLRPSRAVDVLALTSGDRQPASS